MAFRNPLRSLPASALTGQISGDQIEPGAMDGKVITGSTVQTSTSGPRIVFGPDDAIRLYSGAARETAPGLIQSSVQTDSGVTSASLLLVGPQIDAIEPLTVEVATSTDGSQTATLGGLTVATYTDGTKHASLVGELTITGGGPGDSGLHLQGGTVGTTDAPIPLTLASGYTAHSGYDPPTIQRMPDGWVRMWGRFDTPATWSSGATVSTITDSSLRPARSWIFTGKAVEAGKSAAVTVEPGGAVRIWNPSGSPTDINLTEIAWLPGA